MEQDTAGSLFGVKTAPRSICIEGETLSMSRRRSLTLN